MFFRSKGKFKYKIKNIIIFLVGLVSVSFFTIIAILLLIIFNLNFLTNPILKIFLKDFPIYLQVTDIKINNFNSLYINQIEVYAQNNSNYIIAKHNIKLLDLNYIYININVINILKGKIDYFIKINKAKSLIAKQNLNNIICFASTTKDIMSTSIFANIQDLSILEDKLYKENTSLSETSKDQAKSQLSNIFLFFTKDQKNTKVIYSVKNESKKSVLKGEFDLFDIASFYNKNQLDSKINIKQPYNSTQPYIAINQENHNKNYKLTNQINTNYILNSQCNKNTEIFNVNISNLVDFIFKTTCFNNNSVNSNNNITCILDSFINKKYNYDQFNNFSNYNRLAVLKNIVKEIQNFQYFILPYLTYYNNIIHTSSSEYQQKKWKLYIKAKNLNFNLLNEFDFTELYFDKDIINYLKESQIAGKITNLDIIIANYNFKNKSNPLSDKTNSSTNPDTEANEKIQSNVTIGSNDFFQSNVNDKTLFISGSSFLQNIDFTYDNYMPKAKNSIVLAYFNENFSEYFANINLLEDLNAIALIKHTYAKKDSIVILCSTSTAPSNIQKFIPKDTIAKLDKNHVSFDNISGIISILLDIYIPISSQENKEEKVIINALANIDQFKWKSLLNKFDISSKNLNLIIKNNTIFANNDNILVNYNNYINTVVMKYKQNLDNAAIAIDGLVTLHNQLINKVDFFKVGGIIDLNFKYRNDETSNFIAIDSDLTSSEFELENMFFKELGIMSNLKVFIDLAKDIELRAYLYSSAKFINQNIKNNFILNRADNKLIPSNNIRCSLKLNYRHEDDYVTDALLKVDENITLLNISQYNNKFEVNLLSDFLDISKITFNKPENKNQDTNINSKFNIKIKTLNLFNKIQLNNLNINIKTDNIGHINGFVFANILDFNHLKIPQGSKHKKIKSKIIHNYAYNNLESILYNLNNAYDYNTSLLDNNINNKHNKLDAKINKFLNLDNKDYLSFYNKNAKLDIVKESAKLDMVEEFLALKNSKLSINEQLKHQDAYDLSLKILGFDNENHFILKTNNAGSLLNGLGAYQKLKNGKLSLLCVNRLDVTYDNLKCNFETKDFIMTENSFFTSLITYVSFSGLIKFITMNRDYEFDNLVGEFILNDNIVNIKAVDSEGLYFDYNAKGNVNLNTKTCYITGRLIPSFFYITKIIKYIPIVKTFLHKRIFAPYRFNFKY